MSENIEKLILIVFEAGLLTVSKRRASEMKLSELKRILRQ